MYYVQNVIKLSCLVNINIDLFDVCRASYPFPSKTMSTWSTKPDSLLTTDSISFWSSVFIDLNTSNSSWSVVTVRLSWSNSSSCWLVRIAGTDGSSDGSEVVSSAAAWATANDAWQTSRSFSWKDTISEIDQRIFFFKIKTYFQETRKWEWRE